MSKETKKGMVPKLRFPEFRDAGEWEEKHLGDVLIFQTGYPFDSGGFSESNGIRLVRNRDLKSDDKIVYYNKSFEDKFLINDGDILVGMDGDFTPCLWNKGKALLNQRVGRVFVKSKNSHNFFYYFLAIHLKEIEENTARTTVKHLSHSDIEKINKPLPHPPEQQKIAACLSSLDDLIAAQSRKVEALKTHKKGLMQQLFPAEGETAPRLRFVEFREAGEWEIKPLGQLTNKVGSGITPSGGDKNYKKQGHHFIRSQNIGWGELLLEDVAFIDDYTHATFPATEIKLNDVLLNITGASIGRCAIADLRIRGGNVNQHVCIIRTEKGLDPFFLSQYLISEGGQDQIESFQAGGNRQGLNFAQIRSFSIPLPPVFAEQQKIAACLSSLDDLIAAQNQKLEALKTHKKGLMQGLFPND